MKHVSRVRNAKRGKKIMSKKKKNAEGKKKRIK